MKSNKTAPAGAVDWFKLHAGFGHDPATETREEAAHRCAVELAAAEEWARDNCVLPQWVRDETYSPDDYDLEDMPEIGWGCILTGPDGERASLWSITFDGNGEPWGKAYARVVAAELALELMPE